MSTTKNLGLFKHDNPKTSTNQFDVDKALNQNWDKTDEAFGKDRDRLDLLEASNTIYDFKGKVDTLANLQLKTKTQGDVWYCEEDSTYYTYTGTDWIPVNLNLKLGVIDELKAKTIKCLQEVETPTPVSGTSIDLSDSADAKITELKISGNSYQETREGYNLLNFKKWKDNNVSWNLGKNIVYGDNYVSGTSEGTDCYSNTVNEQYRFNCEPNTTYTLFYINDNSIMCRPIAFVYDSESKNIQTLELGLSADNIIIRRFTTSSEAGKMAIRLGANVDGVNFKFSNIMILKGIYDKSTIPNYEQYGVAPSPDYPAEIKTVGSNVNLIEETFEGYNINANGAFEKLNGFDIQIVKVKANVKYTLNTNTNLLGYYNEKPTTSSITYDKSRTVLSSSTNVIIPSKTGYIAIRTSNTAKVKLVEGTEVGEYSPYGQGCINEVICNENLYDEEYYDGKGYNSNTGILETNTNLYCNKNCIYILRNGKRKVSLSKNGIGKNTRFFFYDIDKQYISTAVGEKNVDIPQNAVYLNFQISKDTVNNDMSNIKIEQNEIATRYVRHQSQTYTIPTQQPIRSIEIAKNTFLRDTFIKKNNKWYERHFITRKILDGTEDWKLYGTNASTYRRFGLDITGDIPKTIKILSDGNKFGKGICSHFKVDMDYKTTDLIEFIQISSPSWYIGITDFNSKWANVEALKTYLSEQYNAGTPLYVDYILETPLDIECTEEQSTILFDIEQNAKTYDKVTHMYSTDEVSPYKEVTYKKDIETLFANTLVEGV